MWFGCAIGPHVCLFLFPSSKPLLYFLESPLFRPDYKWVHVRSLSLHELIHQLKSALTSVDLSACHDSQLLWFISISWYSTYHDLLDCHNLSLIMIISYYDLSAYHNFSTYHDLSPVLKWLIMLCLAHGGRRVVRWFATPFATFSSLHLVTLHPFNTPLLYCFEVAGFLSFEIQLLCRKEKTIHFV